MKSKKKVAKRTLKKICMSILAVVMIVTVLVSSLPEETQQILAATKTADANTTETYKESLGNNDTTEWAGRVWTDKTVYSQDAVFANEKITVENDSDFLVSYSALATTQEIKGGITAPVDVVFVIDVSGSMTAGIDSNSDNGTRISNTIAALNNSIHTLMSENENNRIGVVTFNKNSMEVLPLARWTTSQTSTNNGVTRYNYFTVFGSTIFVNATSTTNGISRKVNRISVTDGTNIQKGLYTGMNMLANASGLTVDVNGTMVKRAPSLVLLSDGAPTFSVRTENWWNATTDEVQGPGGSPHYGNGMLAMMTGAYMKQVVDAKYSVANTASRTKIYTIGMGLDGLSGNDLNLARVTLNPEDYYDANNGMASSIKTAFTKYAKGESVNVEVNSYSSSGGEKDDELKTRTIVHPTEGTIDVTSIKDYVDAYYAASSASSVNEVFTNIIDSITVNSAMAPTEISKDGPFESGEGDVIYTDPIGKYMEVKDVKAIVYAGQKFEVKETSTEGNKTTYVFEGEVNNAVYGEHNLSEIQITVTEDTNGNQTLEVRIPAGAMPLRVNKVQLNSDNSVKSHTNNGAYPIRVLYTVGVKNDIINDGVIDSSKVSQEYISANRNEDGSVNFYSNLYTGNTAVVDGAETTIGDATVTFKPALDNPFYYVQEPIEIYTNSELTQKLSASTEIRDNVTYYYKDVYYEGNNRVERAIARTGIQLKQVKLEESNGYWVRPAGTQRQNRMFHFEGTKDKNDTKTAAEFYTPIFENGQVVVHLGNNGVLTAMVGGSLSISKTVTADAGLTAPDKEFTFTITLRDSDNNSLSGNYEYIVVDKEGNAVTDDEGTPVTGTVGNNGTIKLKADQTATILDLPIGTTYEVIETAVDGFTTKVGTTETNRVFGEIVSGEKEEVVFTNNYSAESVTIPAAAAFPGKKVLQGRQWANGDSFTFKITPAEGSPAPEHTTVTVTNEDAKNSEAEFNFGSVTFETPDTYTYLIIEQAVAVEDRLSGVTYSLATYEVKVKVVDNGEGKLVVESNNMVQIQNDRGAEVRAVAAEEAVFTNLYSPEEVSWGPLGTKNYTDNSGQKPLTDGMFTFAMKAVGENAAEAPMPEDLTPDANGEVFVTNTENVFHFDQATYTQDMIGETFTYQVREVIPEGATTSDNGKTYTYQGMIYDGTIHTVEVKVTYVDPDIVVIPTYDHGNRIVFENTYTPEEVVLGSDTNLPINGVKTLTGRDMNDGETFDFTLEAANQITTQAITDEIISLEKTTAVVAGGKNGKEVAFDFGETTFKKPGTYTFNIRETKGDAKGVTYDSHVCTVTVEVTDAEGKLVAEVTYNNGTGNDDTKAEFLNAYEATFDDSTTVNLSGTKNLVGEVLDAGEYYFTIQPQNNAPMGDSLANNPNEAGIKNNDGSYTGNITLLKNIKYTKPGTYTYIIKENIPTDKRGGITYDESVYEVTVVVVDDNNGNLKANKPVIKKQNNGNETDAEEIVFNNTYEAAPAVLVPGRMIKVLEGDRSEPLKDNEFQFKMSIISATPEGGVTLPNPSVVGNAADGTIQFGAITFTEPGTYTLQVAEVVPSDNEKVAGVTYDDHVIHATITVTDNNEGQLVAVLTHITGSYIFNNVYKTTGTLVGATNLKVTKNFTGRENDNWLDTDEFRFILVPNNTVTEEAVANGDIILPDNAGEIKITANDSPKEASFGDITFNAVGQYEFRIRERTDSLINGVDYDSDYRIITVTTTDNNDGTLAVSAEVTSEKNLTFNNTYNPEDTILYGHHDLMITKNFTGRENDEWLDTDEFTFKLEAADQTTLNAINSGYIIMPQSDEIVVTKKNKNHIHFGDIVFNKSGDYTFTVTEVDSGIEGIKYDTKPRNIIVNVVDNNDATMTATINENSDELVFNNIYSTEEVILEGATNLKITKELSGRDWFEDDIFEFTLSVTDSDTSKAIEDGYVVLPENKTIAISGKDNNKEKAFGNIIFKKTGTYKFNISETEGNVKGINYDEHTAVVTVVVTDNQIGQLVAAASTTEGDMTFTNTYTPQPITETLSGTKKMSGRELMDTDVFGFTITKASDSPNDTPMPDVTTVENDKDGNITFSSITYAKAGTYSYIIKETSGSAPGVVNDSHEVRATVEVTYNPATGTLSSKVVYDGDGFVFTNKYKADPTNSITGFSAKKKVNVSEGNSYELKGGEFEFSITPASNNPASDPVNAKTVTNDSDGNISLVYSEVIYDAPGEYVYTVKEISDKQLAGIGYDSSIYTITVNVVDNKQTGKLEGTLVITKDNKAVDEIVFENNYNPLETSVNISGKKVLEGKALETGEFKFEIAGENQAPMPAENTVTNVEDEFQFGTITYKKPGTYEYNISEVNEGKQGYSYDDTVYQIQVTVRDEKGELKAQVTGNENVVFNNTYKPTPVTLKGDTALKGNKTLTGRQLNEGEFVFQLVDANQKVVSEVNNSADGSFVFEDLTFEASGTYYYTILEKINGVGGVKYDTNSYTVEIQVEDKGGYLEAVTKYLTQGKEAAEGVVFENTYEPQSTSIQLGATKKLTGRDIKAKEFTFVLKDENGNIVSETTNDEAGVILFDKIVYDKEGTYTYTVSEEKGDAKNVTYDDTVYTVTVTVKDSLQGYLEATIDYDGKELIFNNSYEDGSEENPNENPTDNPTKDPGKNKINKEKTSPKTKDFTPIFIVMIIGILSLLSAVKISLIREREHRYKNR